MKVVRCMGVRNAATNTKVLLKFIENTGVSKNNNMVRVTKHNVVPKGKTFHI